MLYLVIVLVFVALTGIGFIIIVAKMPKLTPKQNIVDKVRDTFSRIFTYRQEAAGLVRDNLSFYIHHNQSALQVRKSNVLRLKQELDRPLEATITMLEPYAKRRAYADFYSSVSTAVTTAQQSIQTSYQLVEDSTIFEPAITRLKEINQASQDFALPALIFENDADAVAKAIAHVEKLVTMLRNLTEETEKLQLTTDEFNTISHSFVNIISKAEPDLEGLRSALVVMNTEAYNRQYAAMPNLIARFDTAQLDHLATSYFMSDPEQGYISDLNRFSY